MQKATKSTKSVSKPQSKNVKRKRFIVNKWLVMVFLAVSIAAGVVIVRYSHASSQSYPFVVTAAQMSGQRKKINGVEVIYVHDRSFSDTIYPVSPTTSGDVCTHFYSMDATTSFVSMSVGEGGDTPTYSYSGGTGSGHNLCTKIRGIRPLYVGVFAKGGAIGVNTVYGKW